VKTRQNFDANLGEISAHGRVNILIGSGYVIATRLQQTRKRRHSDTAYCD
jgi:hypothetical protein